MNIELGKRRGAALRSAAITGRRMQEDIPEIAAEYRNGDFIREIVKRHDIKQKYEVTPAIARTAVQYAIRGFSGGLSVDAYVGLIDDKQERDDIANLHLRQSSGEIGKKAVINKTGVHGKSLEERTMYALNAARLGGEQSLRDKVGVHGRTYEERVEHAYQSHLSRGLIRWSDEEKKRAEECLGDKQYWYQTGNHKGKPNMELITKTINDEYHDGTPIRTGYSIRLVVNYNKKQKGENK